MRDETKVMVLVFLVVLMIVGGFQLHRWFDHVEYERCISVGGSPGGTGGCNLECRSTEKRNADLEYRLNAASTKLEICEERRR